MNELAPKFNLNEPSYVSTSIINDLILRSVSTSIISDRHCQTQCQNLISSLNLITIIFLSCKCWYFWFYKKWNFKIKYFCCVTVTTKLVQDCWLDTCAISKRSKGRTLCVLFIFCIGFLARLSNWPATQPGSEPQSDPALLGFKRNYRIRSCRNHMNLTVIKPSWATAKGTRVSTLLKLNRKNTCVSPTE